MTNFMEERAITMTIMFSNIGVLGLLEDGEEEGSEPAWRGWEGMGAEEKVFVRIVVAIMRM